ncbi:hypothetical protein QBC43DRAFT_68166 [Cladorrhinum sp. PSN259]|nr:hypothetical protein QBC43DRAFT_68166 [Cladorrhinum sp. PSN259]
MSASVGRHEGGTGARGPVVLFCLYVCMSCLRVVFRLYALDTVVRYASSHRYQVGNAQGKPRRDVQDLPTAWFFFFPLLFQLVLLYNGGK